MSKETLGWVIILTSPIWFPVTVVLAIIALPLVILGVFILAMLQRWYGI